jgi:hypothetical protein
MQCENFIQVLHCTKWSACLKVLGIILVNCGVFFSDTKCRNLLWGWLKVMLCSNEHVPHTQGT